MKKINLIIILYVDFPSFIGLSKRVEGIVSSLSRMEKFNIIVFSPKFLGISIETLKRLRIECKQLHICYVNLPRFFSKHFRGLLSKTLISFLYSIIVFFKIFSLNIVNKDTIIQTEHIVLLPIGIFLEKLKKCFLIADDINLLFIRVRNSLIKRVIYLLELILYKHANILTSASTKTYNFALKNNLKIKYIPNIIISSENYNLNINKEKIDKSIIEIVFVANMRFYQNILALLNLYFIIKILIEKYKITNIRLNIIGGPLEYIPLVIKESMLVKRRYITLYGEVEESIKKKVYERSHIAIFPYFKREKRWGGQMTKVIEAMAHYLIIVAGSEAIKEVKGENGIHFLVANNYNEMINILRQLTQNIFHFYPLMINAYRLVKNFYSYKMIQRKYKDIIDDFYAKKR